MQQFRNVFSNRKRVIVGFLGLAILGYLVLQVAQFVVFGLPTNPPVTHEVQWDSPRTEELWSRACQDCHSNETVYPWYSYLFPSYLLVMNDVLDAREKMNVSTNNLDEAHEIREMLEEGEMPPSQYLIVHPNANLTGAEKAELIAGLQATFNIRFDD
jgi:hypothetical protein